MKELIFVAIALGFLVATVVSAPAAAKPKPPKPATNPADLQAGVKTPADFITALPAELAPRSGVTWDEFTEPKAKLWLRDNTDGIPCELTFTLKATEKQRIPEPGDKLQTKGWAIGLDLKPEVFTVNGRSMAAKLFTRRVPDTDGLTTNLRWVGDEALARQVADWAPESRVTIRGTIANVLLNDFTHTHATKSGSEQIPGIGIALKDWEIVSIGKWKPTTQPAKP